MHDVWSQLSCITDNLCIDVNRTSVQRTRKAGYLNSKERLLGVLSWLALDRGGRIGQRETVGLEIIQ